MGCCGETARCRLQAWERCGIWNQLHQSLLSTLNHEKHLETTTVIIDSTHVRAFGGGDLTGPSPADRRKKGTKLTLLVDRRGVPLVIRCAGGNSSDHREILPTVADFPTVGGKPGRPRTRPQKLYADAGYDSELTRDLLRLIGIEPHIRYKSDLHVSHLGRVCWVVERTISWITGLRRLRVRYDRSAITILAWTIIAASVIRLNILRGIVA
jgi:transposase